MKVAFTPILFITSFIFYCISINLIYSHWSVWYWYHIDLMIVIDTTESNTHIVYLYMRNFSIILFWHFVLYGIKNGGSLKKKILCQWVYAKDWQCLYAKLLYKKKWSQLYIYHIIRIKIYMDWNIIILYIGTLLIGLRF